MAKKKKTQPEWQHWINHSATEAFWALDLIPQQALTLFVTHKLVVSLSKKPDPYVATVALAAGSLPAHGSLWTASRRTLAKAQEAALKEGRRILWDGMDIANHVKLGD